MTDGVPGWMRCISAMLLRERRLDKARRCAKRVRHTKRWYF